MCFSSSHTSFPLACRCALGDYYGRFGKLNGGGKVQIEDKDANLIHLLQGQELSVFVYNETAIACGNIKPVYGEHTKAKESISVEQL